VHYASRIELDASMSAGGVPAAAVTASLNLAQAALPSNAAAAVMSRTSFSALAIAVPSAGIVSKSNFLAVEDGDSAVIESDRFLAL